MLGGLQASKRSSIQAKKLSDEAKSEKSNSVADSFASPIDSRWHEKPTTGSIKELVYVEAPVPLTCQQWLQSWNLNSNKKIFLILYISIFETSFYGWLLLTYNKNKCFNWAIIWPIFDVVFSVSLMCYTKYRQCKLRGVYNRSGPGIEVSKANIFIHHNYYGLMMLEFLKIVLTVSYGLHVAVGYKFTFEPGLVIIYFLIDTFTLGNDFRGGPFHYYHQLVILLFDLQMIVITFKIQMKSPGTINWIETLIPLQIYLFAGILIVVTSLCCIGPHFCNICCMEPEERKRVFTELLVPSYFTILENVQLIPALVFIYVNIDNLKQPNARNPGSPEFLPANRAAGTICLWVVLCFVVLKWAVFLFIGKVQRYSEDDYQNTTDKFTQHFMLPYETAQIKQLKAKEEPQPITRRFKN